MSDRAQALQDRIDEMENANPWRKTAEVGDVLAGEVEYVDVRSTKHNPSTPVLGVRDDSGKLHEIYAFGTVLCRKVLEAKPQPGEFIYIKRLEDKISRSRQEPYHVFKFVVDREASKRFDWSRLAPAEDGEEEEDEEEELSHEEIMRRLTESEAKRASKKTLEDDPLPFEDDEA